jgi:hypothetical protein
MKAQVLLIGAILTPGKRVVSEVLRVMGLSQSRQFAQYHQVLNRAVWSPLELAPVLLRLLVATFVPADQPLVFGIDPTLERRRGGKIGARGIYRDAVRSSDSHFVKASGLRWISLMLLTTISWAQRVWALPVRTVLSPSERYYQRRQRVAKTLLDRSLQMLKLLRRWLPGRELVVVGDNAYAALDFLAGARQIGVTMIARLRLDAALYEPAPPYSGHGRPRKKGKRLPTPATMWLCCIPTRSKVRSTSPPGLSNAGRWKSPSRKPVVIWALKHSASGRTKRLPAPPRCYWVCFSGSRWWCMDFTSGCPFRWYGRLPGTLNHCPPFPMP